MSTVKPSWKPTQIVWDCFKPSRISISPHWFLEKTHIFRWWHKGIFFQCRWAEGLRQTGHKNFHFVHTLKGIHIKGEKMYNSKENIQCLVLVWLRVRSECWWSLTTMGSGWQGDKWNIYQPGMSGALWFPEASLEAKRDTSPSSFKRKLGSSMTVHQWSSPYAENCEGWNMTPIQSKFASFTSSTV